MQRKLEERQLKYSVVYNEPEGVLRPDGQGRYRDNTWYDCLFSKFDDSTGMYVREDPAKETPSYKCYLFTSDKSDTHEILAMYPNGVVVPVSYNPNMFSTRNMDLIHKVMREKYPKLDYRTLSNGVFAIEYFTILGKNVGRVNGLDELIRYYSSGNTSVYNTYSTPGEPDVLNVTRDMLLTGTRLNDLGYRIRTDGNAVVRVIHFIPMEDITSSETLYYSELNLVITTRGLDFLVHENNPRRVRTLTENRNGISMSIDIINNDVDSKEYWFRTPDNMAKSIMSHRDDKSLNGAYITYTSNSKVVDVKGPIPLDEIYKYGLADEKSKLYKEVKSSEELELEKLYLQNERLELEKEAMTMKHEHVMTEGRMEHEHFLSKHERDMAKLNKEKQLIELDLWVEKEKSRYGLVETERKSKMNQLDMELYIARKTLDAKIDGFKSFLEIDSKMINYAIAYKHKEDTHKLDMEVAVVQNWKAKLDLITKATQLANNMIP